MVIQPAEKLLSFVETGSLFSVFEEEALLYPILFQWNSKNTFIPTFPGINPLEPNGDRASCCNIKEICISTTQLTSFMDPQNKYRLLPKQH
jgi:hypothetical protein